MKWLVCAVAAAVSCTARAGDLTFLPRDATPAHDSLDVGEDPSADARDCLHGLAWRPAEFVVRCEPVSTGWGDAWVRFASPVKSGHAENDRVALQWFVARDRTGQPVKAPAVVVAHESGRRMTAGRLCAWGLNRLGLHTFLIHLPYYGRRRPDNGRPAGTNPVTLIRQAVADVRRARDAVAALPLVDRNHIALQGTSLGGFVAATTAGLDRGFDSVFLLLAGGDVYGIIQNGKKDSAKVRRKLEQAGWTGEKLAALTRTIEPLRIAHRLDARRTWLYSGKHDTVVPIKNAVALARAARLAPSHHFRMEADHYSGIVYLPFVLTHIASRIDELHAADTGAAGDD